MAKKKILKFRIWLWSSVLGVMGLFLTGCPPEPPVVEYGPPPPMYGALYGIPIARMIPMPDAADTIESIEDVSMKNT